MPRITFHDGKQAELPEGEPIGSVLPPGSIAANVGDRLVDLSWVPDRDVRVEPVSGAEPDGLRVLRHSAAHVMAQAVCDLFPGARYAIGPPIEDGFYYDFDLDQTLSPEDLPRIEGRMREIMKTNQPFVREELQRDDALKLFADQPFKKEIIEGVEAEEGALGDRVSVYRNDGWADLCLGPHVPATGRIGAFKLLSVAGAYWRGDEARPQLQRIYGTAWASQEDLDAYLHRLEEAERRDHRKLGKELDLFSIHEDAGAGLIYWHPKGGLMRVLVEDVWREEHLKDGYDIVYSPHI